MLGAITGNPSRNDLAAFRRKKPEVPGILIVNGQFAIRTKTAYLAPVISYLASTSITSIQHRSSPLEQIALCCFLLAPLEPGFP